MRKNDGLEFEIEATSGEIGDLVADLFEIVLGNIRDRARH
jgi:hypothetical protein